MPEPKPNTIDLSEPVKIDGKDVDKITLRKPGTGELRGLKLAEIMTMDVNTLITLLPRITMPPLREDQVAALDVADFSSMATGTLRFFMKGAQLKQMGVT